MGWIIGGSMAWADDMLASCVVVNLAAGMSAGGIVGDELVAGEMDEYARIS